LQREVEVKELRNTTDGQVCWINGLFVCCAEDIINRNPYQARDLQEARTSLAKAETSKTHLEQRVEELSRTLQGDAERLAVYERRSLAVNGATHHTGVEGGSQVQPLDAEVADLR
jgi:nucleoprotein TPR